MLAGTELKTVSASAPRWSILTRRCASKPRTDPNPKRSFGLGNRQNLVCRDILQNLLGSRRPSNFNFVHRVCHTQAEVNRAGAGRGISGRGGLVDELSLPPGHDPNPRTDSVAITLRAAQDKFKPMVVIRTVIQPDFRWGAKRGNHNVEFSVVIQVADGSSAVAARGQRAESCLRCQRGQAARGPISKN